MTKKSKAAPTTPLHRGPAWKGRPETPQVNTPVKGKPKQPPKSPASGLKSPRAAVGTPSSVASAATTESQKLEDRVVKQVIRDIEGAGGIKKFDKGKKQGLAELLDSNEDGIYGVRWSNPW